MFNYYTKIGFICFLIGSAATFCAVKVIGPEPLYLSDYDEGEENMEEKLEEARVGSFDNDFEVSDYKPADGCQSEEELKVIEKRFRCSRKPNKSISHWDNIRDAEREVLKILKERDMNSLIEYTSCDAMDLTWYELHCESDRVFVDERTFTNLFQLFDRLDESLLTDAKWERVYPNKKKFRNPQWVRRSRLKSSDMKLGEPWKTEKHPFESETIVLLEQRLDGKVYISGIPVTGVDDEGHSK